jgi:GT2 family glycosyltransferase
LFYPDGSTQHAGVTVTNPQSMAMHIFRHTRPFQWTNFGMPDWPRDYLAVTGACQMISAKVFDKIGGYDEGFKIAGSDVVFCLQLHEAGYRNVYWPFARMKHYESVSVINYQTGTEGDYQRSLIFYKPYFVKGDPFYNPNLSLMKEDLSLRDSI